MVLIPLASSFVGCECVFSVLRAGSRPVASETAVGLGLNGLCTIRVHPLDQVGALRALIACHELSGDSRRATLILDVLEVAVVTSKSGWGDAPHNNLASTRREPTLVAGMRYGPGAHHVHSPVGDINAGRH